MSRRSTVFVANLPPNVQKQDLEDVFEKYGPIVKVDLKTSGPDPIAFVEYEDARDCEDAIRGRDGYDMDGYRLRCDLSNGGRRDRHGERNGDRSGAVRGSRPPGPPSRRTEWRIRITGLPKSGSWQDLKDHMREAGEVCYSEIFGDGTGAVEYSTYDMMKTAMRKLDDTRFKSHEGETSYISISEDRGGAKSSGIPRGPGGGRFGDRFRDRSPGRKRFRRSPSYSPPPRRNYRSSPSYRGRSRSRSPRRHSPSSSPARKSYYS